MNPILVHVVSGWILFLGGVISGALLGIFFHRESFLGGYGSERRRLVRLGHIAFFGMGFLNLSYAGTLALNIGAPASPVMSGGFLIGAIGMPLCCMLMAIDQRFRLLFPIPVIALAVSIWSMVIGLAHQPWLV